MRYRDNFDDVLAAKRCHRSDSHFVQYWRTYL